MKQFRKRTIALVLASVVTVVGAFAADNYKNSLMGLSFDGSSGGAVNLVLQTKLAYEGNISPTRTDANTYVLMLPEVNSMASTPDLRSVSANISSINIRTMPYSNNAKGYTRITIKTTNPTMSLSTSNRVFIGTINNDAHNQQDKKDADVSKTVVKEIKTETESIRNVQKTNYVESANPISTESTSQEVENPDAPADGMIEVPAEPEPVSEPAGSDSNGIYLWLWALLIVMGSALFYTHAKTKMREIAGEKLDIDVDDDSKAGSKRKKLGKIKNAVNALDSAYPNSHTMPKVSEYSVSSAPVKKAKPAEELDVVDLDALFKEHKAKSASKPEEDEENDALEDFLSGFSFDGVEEEAQEVEEEPFDEEAFQSIINNKKLRFSRDDLECINKLLAAEVSDDTMRNIEQYAVSNPIRKIPSKQELMEGLIADYAISQNIIFSRSDIEILNKLGCVELDVDFVTDLRTNAERTREMEQEIIEAADKPKKPSEIVTLSVKDLLPDLSDALKKQGNRKIESNYKTDAVYCSEGYEVSKLSLNESLPDLSVEIGKKDAFAPKPSAEIQIVDTSYVVGSGELKASSELPDLQDVLANPEKYTTSEVEEVVVDEDTLLKNISNVQFKPFYDGTNEFEVLNDLDNAPSMADIQAEFSQFAGFEISEEEQFEKIELDEENDDFNSLYSGKYVDLDKPTVQEERKEPVKQEVKSEPEPEILPRKRPESVRDEVRKVEKTDVENKIGKAKVGQKDVASKAKKDLSAVPAEQSGIVRCILDGEVFNVVSSTEICENKGCYLAKNDAGYVVLGYVGDKLIKLNSFDELKSEKIHSRAGDQLEDGTTRYIIRIGVNKFLVNVKDDNIDYLMDL